ncbi:unnamed protein product [Amoebophrya sp. A120]|nr:unnamed protein product [Amoebophrya sp. A120]|eukprot:GSA120T00016765001.1
MPPKEPQKGASARSSSAHRRTAGGSRNLSAKGKDAAATSVPAQQDTTKIFSTAPSGGTEKKKNPRDELAAAAALATRCKDGSKGKSAAVFKKNPATSHPSSSSSSSIFVSDRANAATKSKNKEAGGIAPSALTRGRSTDVKNKSSAGSSSSGTATSSKSVKKVVSSASVGHGRSKGAASSVAVPPPGNVNNAALDAASADEGPAPAVRRRQKKDSFEKGVFMPQFLFNFENEREKDQLAKPEKYESDGETVTEAWKDYTRANHARRERLRYWSSKPLTAETNNNRQGASAFQTRFEQWQRDYRYREHPGPAIRATEQGSEAAKAGDEDHAHDDEDEDHFFQAEEKDDGDDDDDDEIHGDGVEDVAAEIASFDDLLDDDIKESSMPIAVRTKKQDAKALHTLEIHQKQNSTAAAEQQPRLQHRDNHGAKQLPPPASPLRDRKQSINKRQVAADVFQYGLEAEAEMEEMNSVAQIDLELNGSTPGPDESKNEDEQLALNSKKAKFFALNSTKNKSKESIFLRNNGPGSSLLFSRSATPRKSTPRRVTAHDRRELLRDKIAIEKLDTARRSRKSAAASSADKPSAPVTPASSSSADIGTSQESGQAARTTPVSQERGLGGDVAGEPSVTHALEQGRQEVVSGRVAPPLADRGIDLVAAESSLLASATTRGTSRLDHGDPCSGTTVRAEPSKRCRESIEFFKQFALHSAIVLFGSFFEIGLGVERIFLYKAISVHHSDSRVLFLLWGLRAVFVLIVLFLKWSAQCRSFLLGVLGTNVGLFCAKRFDEQAGSGNWWTGAALMDYTSDGGMWRWLEENLHA